MFNFSFDKNKKALYISCRKTDFLQIQTEIVLF